MIKFFIIALCLHHAVYAAPSFLTISDIHYGNENALKDGQDTGTEFLHITLNQFKKLSGNVDFILFLGDLPTHSLFNNSSKKEEYEKVVFHGLYENDIKSKPMFYIPGNNDSLQGNYQPFNTKGISPLNFAKDWDGACAHCKGLMIDDTHMYDGGYYSSYVIPHNEEIILIALNATQWTHPPFFLKYPDQEKDAAIQLFWLEQQLKKHRAKQLLIAMHEPPGNSYQGKPFWHQDYLQKFVTLLAQNNHLYGQITLLTAHTHMDEFRKIHLNSTMNIYAYSTPGISRIHHNYPGMKRFDFDEKLKIKDFTTYYTSHLNQWGNQKYHAIRSPNAIFSHCHNQTLSQCLNKLSAQQVCHDLDKGLFYGVKSPYVQNNACSTIYDVTV